MRSRFWVSLTAALGVASTSLLAPGCFTATNTEPGGADPDAAGLADTERLDGYPLHPQAPCLVTVDAPPLLSRDHVAIGTPVQYDSNPASSGPHYPIWAAYQEYTVPVDARYYVHDEEHGAVILLYNCPPSSDCTSVVTGLEQVVASVPPDPACVGSGVSVRYVLAPDPTIPTPIAAAAWGFVYTAACLDLPSLEQFAAAHHAQGPEEVCTDGIIP